MVIMVIMGGKPYDNNLQEAAEIIKLIRQIIIDELLSSSDLPEEKIYLAIERRRGFINRRCGGGVRHYMTQLVRRSRQPTLIVCMQPIAWQIRWYCLAD